jgi:hypothetical protein
LVEQVGGWLKVWRGNEGRFDEKLGARRGIVIASIFWWVLPMSIPVWITQAKKLKNRKREIYEQQQRGCPPQ